MRMIGIGEIQKFKNFHTKSYTGHMIAISKISIREKFHIFFIQMLLNDPYLVNISVQYSYIQWQGAQYRAHNE